MKEGYIGGRTGGVPEAIFSQSKPRFRAVSATGRGLDCLVTPEVFTISVEGDISTHFQARILGGVLNLNIHNKGADNQGERHPDIYAKKLAHRFVDYAQGEGQEIKTIMGGWSPTSDNYEQFRKYVDEREKHGTISEEDEAIAASRTWTGSLAHELGYEEATVMNDWRKEGFVRVNFKRGIDTSAPDVSDS